MRESTGGIATLRVTVELDSTTSRWTRTTSSLPAAGGACRSNTHIEEGTVPAATRDALFADARERAFLDLPAQYRASGQVADGMAHRMVITTSGFTSTMRWEDGDDLPPLLDRYVTNLANATMRQAKISQPARAGESCKFAERSDRGSPCSKSEESKSHLSILHRSAKPSLFLCAPLAAGVGVAEAGGQGRRVQGGVGEILAVGKALDAPGSKD